jgi:hypothetical protein
MYLFNFDHKRFLTTPTFDSGENDRKNISQSVLNEVVEFNSASHESTKTSSDEQLEQLISNLLRYGVLIA